MKTCDFIREHDDLTEENWMNNRDIKGQNCAKHGAGIFAKLGKSWVDACKHSLSVWVRYPARNMHHFC